MKDPKWTAAQVMDLIQQQLHLKVISEDDVLSTLGDYRPLKILSRGDIAELVQPKLKAANKPIALLSDITDAVIDDLEGSVGLDDLTWAGIEATVDAIIQEYK